MASAATVSPNLSRKRVVCSAGRGLKKARPTLLEGRRHGIWTVGRKNWIPRCGACARSTGQPCRRKPVLFLMVESKTADALIAAVIHQGLAQDQDMIGSGPHSSRRWPRISVGAKHEFIPERRIQHGLEGTRGQDRTCRRTGHEHAADVRNDAGGGDHACANDPCEGWAA